MMNHQGADKHSTFLIWDGGGVPPAGNWIPVLWQSYDEIDGPGHSLPRLVETEAETLRARFLAWIYELGIRNIGGRPLIDHLELRPGFSYWWMTLLAEKSNAYKSQRITDVLKLLALEELVSKQGVSTIILASDDKTLAETFRLWCQNAGFAFSRRPVGEAKTSVPWRRKLYFSLPHPVQAFISLMLYVWQCWSTQQGIRDQKNCGDITFVNYLIHLNQKALITGSFASNLWTDLVGALDRSGTKTNWLHHYIKHEALPSTKQAWALLDRFNENARGRQVHTCLDGALSVSVLLASLRDYGRLLRISLQLRKIKRQFCSSPAGIDFWPLFRNDWRNSLRGPAALTNCLVLNLFERTFRRLRPQKLGVYLQENQDWEMAMIYAWRAAGHGRLIGVPHATVRFWDLRYYYDPRCYVRRGKNDLPLPDMTALNGPVAMAAYRETGYPVEQMVEVEALRYLYLANRPVAQAAAKTQTPSNSLRVLVPLDYLPAVTRQQMLWLMEVAPLLPPYTRFIVKAHPNLPVQAEDYPSLPLQITSSTLDTLLDECDVVYAGNITSVVVDAYCAGVPVVSMLDGGALNMSPLRGLAGVIYVTNPAELAEALRTVSARQRCIPEPYFCLDKGLPRWQKLLGIGPAGVEEEYAAA